MAATPTRVPDDRRPIVFVVPGQRQDAAAALTRGRAPGAAAPAALPGQVKASVIVGARRGASELHEVEAIPGEDVVVLRLANGPELILHPESARDLLLAQAEPTRGGPGITGEERRIVVTAQLRWHGLERAAPTRGRLGDVLLAALEVLTGFGKAELVDFAGSEVVRRVDAQVKPGVYALEPGALERLATHDRVATMPAADGPTLVLVHGTFVETTSTFKKLWSEHPARVRALFEKYQGRVFALDHPTLGASPVANAITLAEACPVGARLHLVTHSRGGLVAEVLARVAHQRQLGKDDFAFFAGDELASQRNELQRLATLVAERDIHVDRVVRVACPARGTLLASKRLDAYLSVLKWTLELAKVPLLPGFVDFVAEVARQRADPARIPGLAAMIPGAPLLNWLNTAPEAIAGELRVVAGDLQGDSLIGWVKTLLADAYYWTDNDVVVHTRSMYAGAPRAGGAHFLLDQGGNVTHFNYFGNQRTAAGIVNGLLAAAPPEGYFGIGPLSWRGESSAGLRGRAAECARLRGGPAARAGERPAVFVLPGILGSNLKAGSHRIWLGLRMIAGLDRLAYKPGGRDDVSPDGAISLVYDDLVNFLERTHDVVEFAFDWRRPIEEEAQRLADAVERELDLRKASGQPVRFVAHSMGGVVVRTMQLERPATWRRAMAVAGARLLMLGTPNGGSWAPMQVLSGDDTFGNALAAFGSPLADHAARELMAAMPGLLQLQAGLTDAALALDQQATWQRLADNDYQRVAAANWWHRAAGELMAGAYRWGVPPQAVLDRAKALRQRLDDQRDAFARDEALAADAKKMLLVVGKARFTPDGFDTGPAGQGDFVYLDAVDGGDGRVPLHSARLPGVRTWMLDAGHGSLPSKEAAFAAYAELLASGSTGQLPELPAGAGVVAATRGGGAAAGEVVRVRSRPSRDRLRARPPLDERGVFAPGDEAAAAPVGPSARLRVSLYHGDLRFVRQPVMLGHYRSLELTGTEYVLDGLVGGAMSASLAAGHYPEAVGSSQIFANTRKDPDNPWSVPRPEAAIVIGLGEEGALEEGALVETVRQGVIGWAQRMAETPGRGGAGVALAATLMGSGGIGISAGAAARALARGVYEANLRLDAAGWPQVTQLTLVELFQSRVGEAWQGLRVLQTSSPEVCVVDEAIRSGQGARRRPPGNGYRGADYDLVRVASVGNDTLEFAIDTQRARTEVRAERAQGRLVRQLVAGAAQHGAVDHDLGRTLFQLLVPVEVEPFLGGTDRVLLDLDAGTAPIPWELLATGPAAGAGEKPWAVRCQLLRKLRQHEFRARPRDASRDDAVLVIGEPKAPQGCLPLPAARAEAQAVYACMAGDRGVGAERVTALIGDADAAEVMTALFTRPYRVVHIAGHGTPPEDDASGRKPPAERSPGGVVLSDGITLSPLEIAKLRTVPELVFVNCCHLGAHDAAATLAGGSLPRVRDRPAFAASIADALIAIGVRCVVAAGWAVAETPARVFAETFYVRLLDGRPFIEAVASAREAAWATAPNDNTWAAYQCYGDPAWTWTGRRRGGSGGPAGGSREFDQIASDVALALTVEDLAVRARGTPGADLGKLEDQLQHLAQRFGARWGDEGAVAEAFGFAFETARNRDQALEWYTRALQAQDGSASLRAAEQRANLQVRRAWSRVEAAANKARKGPPAAEALAAGRDAIGQAIADLERLVTFGGTIERLSLLGSAHKRMAMIARLAGDAQAERDALAATAAAYGRAESVARELASPQLFYPALNRMAAELVLNAGAAAGPGFDTQATAAVAASLQARHDDDPDFWSATSRIELRVYQAVAARSLAAGLPALAQEFDDVRRRRDVPSEWESVAQQASFVLLPYAQHAAAPAERAAALELHRTLDAYAQGKRA